MHPNQLDVDMLSTTLLLVIRHFSICCGEIAGDLRGFRSHHAALACSRGCFGLSTGHFCRLGQNHVEISDLVAHLNFGSWFG